MPNPGSQFYLPQSQPPIANDSPGTVPNRSSVSRIRDQLCCEWLRALLPRHKIGHVDELQALAYSFLTLYGMQLTRCAVPLTVVGKLTWFRFAGQAYREIALTKRCGEARAVESGEMFKGSTRP
jgi:hypothetical protein